MIKICLAPSLISSAVPVPPFSCLRLSSSNQPLNYAPSPSPPRTLPQYLSSPGSYLACESHAHATISLLLTLARISIH